MYKSVVDIWNGALAMLPHDRRIESIDEDSTEALRMRDLWDRVRHQVITKHEWGWLTHATPMICGAHCNHATNAFSYPYPQGAIRVIGLFDKDGRRVKCDVANHTIFSPASTASIRYLPDCTDVEKYPVWFADALVTALAENAAPLFHGASNNSRLVAQSNLRLSEAIRIDSSEAQWSGTDGRTFAKARV